MGFGKHFRHALRDAVRVASWVSPIDQTLKLVTGNYKANTTELAIKGLKKVRDYLKPQKQEGAQPAEGDKAQDYGAEYLAAMNEQMAAMQEYLAQQAALANQAEPAAEPLKTAPDTYTAQQSDSSRKQLLRRGLLSTYAKNRFTSSPSSGKALALGA